MELLNALLSLLDTNLEPVSGPIILFGLFGVGNIGNDSSLEAILYNIKLRYPAAQVICICGNPALVTRLFSIETYDFNLRTALESYDPKASRGLVGRISRKVFYDLRFAFRSIRWLKDKSRFIVVGTGMLDDFGVPPWHMPYFVFKWTLAARLARKKVDYLSVGVGPIVHPVSKSLMLGALRMSTYRSYRDLYSLDYLKKVGFDVRDDPVYPDLVFSHPVGAGGVTRPPNATPRVIGLGVMGYYGWSNSPQKGEAIYQRYLENLKQVVCWLLEEGYTIRLITGEMPTDGRPAEELMKYVEEEIPLRAHEICYEPICDADQLFHAIAQTDLVIATRFHNVLCSLMMHRPVLSLGYSLKNDALMKEMGLEDYCQHVEHIDIDRLLKDFKQLAATSAEAGQRIRLKCVEYQQKLAEQYQFTLGI